MGPARHLVGFVVSIPFLNLAGFHEGSVATALGGVDNSWAASLLVAAVTYYVLTRSLYLTAEGPAIKSSARDSGSDPHTA